MAKKTCKLVKCDEETLKAIKKIQAETYLETGKLVAFGDILRDKILKNNQQKINFRIKFDGDNL